MCQFCTANLINDIIVMFLLSVLESNITLLCWTFVGFNLLSKKYILILLAYAVRFEVDEIILFYPNTVRQNQEEESELAIKDALANEKEISVRAIQLPIINRQLLDHDFDTKLSLRDLFETTWAIIVQCRKFN